MFYFGINRQGFQLIADLNAKQMAAIRQGVRRTAEIAVKESHKRISAQIEEHRQSQQIRPVYYSRSV
jgi:hypothetical protein